MNYNIDEINHLIRNRRSLYPAQYTGEKVDDAIIEEILENARWAPTHKMTEPWKFVVFSGDGLRQLADFQSELYKELNTGEAFVETKYKGLQEKPLKASHIIAIGMTRNEQVPEVEEVAAVACAVQNMYLTANAYGLGCYWGSGGITYKEEAKEFFGLGEQDRLLGFFYIGVTAMEKPASRRVALEDKVVWRS